MVPTFLPPAIVFRAHYKKDKWFIANLNEPTSIFTKNWLYCSLFYFTTNEDTKQADEMPGYPLNRVTGHHSCSSTSNREKKKEWGKAGRKREEKKKKKSLVDPEIIAHAMTYQECGSSGGQIVVYSLSEGPQRERHKRGKGAAIGLRSGGTRVSCGRTWHKACPNREHTHSAGIRLRNPVYEFDPTPNSMSLLAQI